MNDGEPYTFMTAGNGYEGVRRQILLHGLYSLAVAESPFLDGIQGGALEDADLWPPTDVEGRIELFSIGGLREYILNKSHVDKRAAV